MRLQDRKKNLPKKPHLCSMHFEESCFDESFAMKADLLGSSKGKRRLKRDAVPTIFFDRPPRTVRQTSINRLERKNRQEFLASIMESTSSESLEVGDNKQYDFLQENSEPPSSITVTRCDVAVQTDSVCVSIFPKQCSETQTEYVGKHDVGIDCDDSLFLSKLNQDLDQTSDLLSDPDDDDDILNDTDDTYFPSSQESYSQNSVEQDPFDDDQLLFVHLEKLKLLFLHCPVCGGVVEMDDIKTYKNQGTMLSVELQCINRCCYIWKSQKDVKHARGLVNIMLTAAIVLSGIMFAKFQQMASLLNLKTISSGTFYKLRNNYVLPSVDKEWKKEQSLVIESANAREESLMLAGDGRCDSPGHSAKYGTYTMLDTDTDKVIDFEVVQVMDVKNSNAMEKEGFIRTLTRIEKDYKCEVYGISTDRHTQIKKYMRESHKDKIHQIDPWHLAKSINKKITAAAKKKNCADLIEWRPSIINHFWWAVDSCEEDPNNLVERFTSVIHHVVNRHKWPGCKVYKKCDHGRLPPAVERKKKWMKAGSSSHQALVKIVKNKRILNDLRHCYYGVTTTMLEVYHSLYLKYLPKIQHFSYDMMVAGTQLAALDHNKNVERNQAVIANGEREGEGRYKIKWSKVTKKFTAQPVLEKKNYSYMNDIMTEALKRAEKKEKHHGGSQAKSMAPQQREHRNIIIENTMKFCRLSTL